MENPPQKNNVVTGIGVGSSCSDVIVDDEKDDTILGNTLGELQPGPPLDRLSLVTCSARVRLLQQR